jgi:hypothetical protein
LQAGLIRSEYVRMDRAPGKQGGDPSIHRAEHPDSPAHGAGPGSSRLPGSIGLPPSGDGSHPDAPAARFGAAPPQTASRSGSSGGGQLAHLTREVAQRIDEQRQALRAALPDGSLQTVFDWQGEHAQSVFRVSHAPDSLRRDVESLLGRLFESIRWIDPQVFASRPDTGVRTTRSVGTEAGDEAAAVQALMSTVERAFALARATVEERWAAAASSGPREQHALVERWKQRMEFRLRGRPTGTGEQEARQIERPRPRAVAPSERKPVKTWVEFQLVDETGAPVSDVAYEITLPDGSAQTGRFGASGKLRFDDIDPGQCRIRFPEIDAKEWRPA